MHNPRQQPILYFKALQKKSKFTKCFSFHFLLKILLKPAASEATFDLFKIKFKRNQIYQLFLTLFPSSHFQGVLSTILMFNIFFQLSDFNKR